tara:strand:- start:3266 stop:3778 length:513 start_codon:yes stop_codon:yes gene_type:complete
MKKKLKKSIVTKAVKKKVVKKPKKKVITSKVKIRKPVKTTVLKLQDEINKYKELRKIERPFIRYSFIVESLKVDKNNIIEEIIFEYKGTMVIPKSQKENYKSGSNSVQGIYIIKEGSIDPLFNKDYNLVKKTELIKHLLDNVREGYILDMRQTIKKELMPEYKIITKLPW